MNAYDYRNTKWVVYRSTLSDVMQVDGCHALDTDLSPTVKILSGMGCSDFHVLTIRDDGWPKFSRLADEEASDD